MSSATAVPEAAPMPAAEAPGHAGRPPVRTAADLPGLLSRLGDIPPERLVLDPPPGTATEADCVAACQGEPKRLCELVEATLVEKAVGSREAFLAMELGSHLRPFAREHDLGPAGGADVMQRMIGGNIRMPDVSFIRKERLPDGKVGADAVSIAPDLAVEIVSVSNTPAELERKRRESFASGAVLVWEIDPRTRDAHVYTAPDTVRRIPPAGSLDGGALLPGFTLKLTDLFAILS